MLRAKSVVLLWCLPPGPNSCPASTYPRPGAEAPRPRRGRLPRASAHSGASVLGKRPHFIHGIALRALRAPLRLCYLLMIQLHQTVLISA
jgi:hypothetical protein